MTDEEYLKAILHNLVDYPDQITIDRTIDDLGVLLTITSHPSDVGKIIGRNGHTIEAIRSLTRVAGFRHKARISVRVVEHTKKYDEPLRRPLAELDSFL